MDFQLFNTDCIPHMAEVMEPESVDMAVFSPPFPSLYAYSSHEADIGNTDSVGSEAKIHLGFFYRALARVLKPGRVAIVHVCQIPRMKRSGGIGLCDFRGINIRIGERAYEEFYQAVKRSNRIGSTQPLNVHIPITELEEPMIQTVLEKAKRVQHDTEEQERLFLKMRMAGK